ncbi:hypothetical protein [Microbispora rosea]
MVKNPDGTLVVTVKELQGPEGLQAELNAQGIRADVTYTPRDKKCAPGRFISADYAYVSPNPKNMTAQHREEFDRPEHWRSRHVTRPISRDKFMISPEFMHLERPWCWSSGLATPREWAGAWEPIWPSPAALCVPCMLVDEGGADAEQAREMAGS